MALKKIIQYHKTFFQSGPGIAFYLLWAAMLGLLFYGNYYGGWGEAQIEALPQGLKRYGLFVLYNAIPYSITMWLYFIFTPEASQQVNISKLLLPATLGLLFLGAYTDFYFHRYLVPDHLPYELYFFTVKCLANGGKALAAFVVLGLLLWLLRVKDTRFYGLFETKADLRPYFILLALMLPLVVAASFQQDFLDYYPRYRSLSAAHYWQIPFGITQLAFQLCYGLDFVAVELVFRGLFVVFMVRYAGKSAVYSMTTIYFMLHFGKPMGEAVSSIFGGFILGVIALYTRSILGGVIIHLGVAWLMEFTAWCQHIYRGTVFD